MGEVESLMSEYRAASTSVQRGGLLTSLALIADDTSDQSLIQFVVDAAEASTEEADESLRIAAMEIFQWLSFPDDTRRRVINWLIKRIETAGRRANERVSAITASRLWVRDACVQAKLLAVVDDETEGEDLRALALDCLLQFRPGIAVPSRSSAPRSGRNLSSTERRHLLG